MVNNLKNNKLTFHLYFFLCLLGHVPLLFSKIAFVDNHEIYSSILYYNNFFEFIKNHNEINPFLGEPSRFRPFYYIIKGIEWFLFLDNNILIFLFRYFLTIIICVLTYKNLYFFFNNHIHSYIFSFLIIFFPTNYDIFTRLGPSEFYVFLFINLFFLNLFNILKKGLSTKRLIIFLFVFFLLPGIKENLYFLELLFVFWLIIFETKVSKIFRKYLFFIIGALMPYTIKYIYMFSYLLKNKIIYTAYEIPFNLNVYSYLLKDFFSSNLLNFFFVFIIIFVFKLYFCKQIKKKIFLYLLFFFLMHVCNYFLYQGFDAYRYYFISVISFFIILSILYKYYFLSKKKLFNYLLHFANILFFVIFVSAGIKVSIDNNINYLMLKKINNYKSDVVILDDSLSERAIFLQYFLFFYNKNISVYLYVDDKNNSKFSIFDNKIRYSFSLKNVISNNNNIFFSDKVCVIFNKNLTNECEVKKQVVMREDTKLFIRKGLILNFNFLKIYDNFLFLRSLKY